MDSAESAESAESAHRIVVLRLSRLTIVDVVDLAIPCRSMQNHLLKRHHITITSHNFMCARVPQRKRKTTGFSCRPLSGMFLKHNDGPNLCRIQDFQVFDLIASHVTGPKLEVNHSDSGSTMP